jgi:hypothetical protein
VAFEVVRLPEASAIRTDGEFVQSNLEGQVKPEPKTISWVGAPATSEIVWLAVNCDGLVIV